MGKKKDNSSGSNSSAAKKKSASKKGKDSSSKKDTKKDARSSSKASSSRASSAKRSSSKDAGKKDDGKKDDGKKDAGKKDDKKDDGKGVGKTSSKAATAGKSDAKALVGEPASKGKARGKSLMEPWKEIDPSFAGRIKIISAKGLMSADIGGKSDPYCKVKDGLNKQKTEPIMHTLDPVWNKEFDVSLKDGWILLELWDHDRAVSDDYLGHVVLRWDKGALPTPKVDPKEKGKSKTLEFGTPAEPNVTLGKEATLTLQRQISSTGKPKGPKVTGTITVLLTKVGGDKGKDTPTSRGGSAKKGDSKKSASKKSASKKKNKSDSSSSGSSSGGSSDNSSSDGSSSNDSSSDSDSDSDSGSDSSSSSSSSSS
jgi:hypothetical protein